MRIEQLPGLRPDQVSRLKMSGVGSCRKLLRISQRSERLSRLAASTGMSLEALQDVMQRAELSQVRGIGPAILAHLLEVGVDSLAALAAQKPEALRICLGQITNRPPNLAVIENWICQARKQREWPEERLVSLCVDSR